MQFLTSIPFLNLYKNNQKNKDSEKISLEIQELREKMMQQDAAIEECAICISQLANTLATLMVQVSATSAAKDPVDEMFDSFVKDDDDGSGYLH